jgi:hypothetical protein
MRMTKDMNAVIRKKNRPATSKYFLALLMIVLFLVNEVAAGPSSVDTRSYFPLEKPFAYKLKAKRKTWQIRHEGPTVVAGKTFYKVNTAFGPPDAAPQATAQFFYSIDANGDIYLNGYPLTDWYVKWLDQPELILKRQMEIGKEYLVADTTNHGRRTLITLVLKKITNVKLKNTVKQCIVIERATKVEGHTFGPPTTYSYEQKFYAHGLGLIKNTGACSCGSGRCALLAPSGGAIILEK